MVTKGGGAHASSLGVAPAHSFPPCPPPCRQHKLEEALLFSGQFAEALQALVDWLYRVEPQLSEDQPVHGDLDLVTNLMDSHKVWGGGRGLGAVTPVVTTPAVTLPLPPSPQAFQKELGKRTSSVQALKRSARELMEAGRHDTAWVRVQLQELSTRWDTVCALSVSKQTRLQEALKQVRATGAGFGVGLVRLCLVPSGLNLASVEEGAL